MGTQLTPQGSISDRLDIISKLKFDQDPSVMFLILMTIATGSLTTTGAQDMRHRTLESKHHPTPCLAGQISELAFSISCSLSL